MESSKNFFEELSRIVAETGLNVIVSVNIAEHPVFIDHDEQACKAIASMTIHNNQKFYIADDNDFNFVLNRAEVLYTFRNLSMKNTSFFTNEVKQALFS